MKKASITSQNTQIAAYERFKKGYYIGKTIPEGVNHQILRGAELVLNSQTKTAVKAVPVKAAPIKQNLGQFSFKKRDSQKIVSDSANSVNPKVNSFHTQTLFRRETKNQTRVLDAYEIGIKKIVDSISSKSKIRIFVKVLTNLKKDTIVSLPLRKYRNKKEILDACNQAITDRCADLDQYDPDYGGVELSAEEFTS